MMPKMDHQSIEVGGVTGLVGGIEAARQRPGALAGAGSWQQQGGGWQGGSGDRHEGPGTSMHESSPLLGNGGLSPIKGGPGGSSSSGSGSSSGDSGLPLVTSLSSALASEVIYCTVSAGQ